MRRVFVLGLALGAAILWSRPAKADFIFFNSGDPDGRMAMASRPGAAGSIEIEAADDFLLTAQTPITAAHFTGLITGGGTVSQIVVEIYRVFPKDSDTGRTPNVPTRTNSPSDVEFDGRDSSAGGLTFTAAVLAPSFTAANSVLNGIHPSPNQRTGGEGAVTGTEVQFNVTFTTPFILPADHYFFVPQVLLTSGQFYWLSAPRPISGAGTTPFAPDLQAWIRNANLDPYWLRVGTDIVGGATPPTFNGSFALETTIPEPSTLALSALAGLSLLACRWRRRRQPTK
jgi:hypothetical protein